MDRIADNIIMSLMGLAGLSEKSIQVGTQLAGRPLKK